jgi:hypothetical protein
MVFQIWDTETANAVGVFTTADEALRAVLSAVEAHGLDYVTTWALEWEDDSGAITVIGEGPALVEHARREVLA